MTPLLRAIGLAETALLCTGFQPSYSQTIDNRAAQESHDQAVMHVNGERVGTISGDIGGTYIRIASVLDDGDANTFDQDFKKFVATQEPQTNIWEPRLEALFKEFVQWQQTSQ